MFYFLGINSCQIAVTILYAHRKKKSQGKAHTNYDNKKQKAAHYFKQLVCHLIPRRMTRDFFRAKNIGELFAAAAAL